MADAWTYREPGGERPRHPPTELAQPAPWRPARYSQTEHLRRLEPVRLPGDPPRARPGFSPAAQARPLRQDPPRAFHAQPPGAWQGPPPWQPQQAARYGQPQHVTAPPPRPRRKRRVFLWVFLAVQALFLIWIIAGLASHPAGPTAAQQAAQQCANGGWQGLFKSQADCQVHYAHGLAEAGNVGKGIGAALIVVFWVVVDFFLGLGYGVYRLASRR